MAFESEVDIEVKANLDDNFEKIMELLKGDKTITIKFANDDKAARRFRDSEGSSGAQSHDLSSAQDRNLEQEHKRLSVQKYRLEIPLLRSQRGQTFTQTAMGAAKGVGGGLMSFAFGGGLGGLTGSIERELMRSAKSSGAFELYGWCRCRCWHCSQDWSSGRSS